MLFNNLDNNAIKTYIRLYKDKKSNLQLSQDIRKIYHVYNEIVRFNLKYSNLICINGFTIHPLKNFFDEVGNYFSFRNEDCEIFAFLLSLPQHKILYDGVRYAKIYGKSSELLVFKSLGDLSNRNWICSVSNFSFNSEGFFPYDNEIVKELKTFLENLVKYDM